MLLYAIASPRWVCQDRLGTAARRSEAQCKIGFQPVPACTIRPHSKSSISGRFDKSSAVDVRHRLEAYATLRRRLATLGVPG
jgi:hypothetical protein